MISLKSENDNRDLYMNIMSGHIRMLKRSQELWGDSKSKFNYEFFQYGNDDFYYYDFIVHRLRDDTKTLLLEIIIKLMLQYGVSMLLPEKRINAPFDFFVEKNAERYGYFIDEYPQNCDLNEIVNEYDVDQASLIRLWKQDQEDMIRRENESNEKSGINVNVISLKSFFVSYFGIEEYFKFKECVDEYISELKEVLGYKSIKFLSLMNLASQKAVSEELLKKWGYYNYKYQFDDNNLSYRIDRVFTADIINKLFDNYIVQKRYKSMLGMNDYAQSFVTSEWLYNSLRGNGNFDYTSIVSGYLKSIEQLLHTIVTINIDNNCKISMSGKLDKRKEAYSKHVELYAWDKKKGDFVKLTINTQKDYCNAKYPYIDLTSEQKDYMDTSMGTYEYFLRNNKRVFIDPSLSDCVASMVYCFRYQCRNGFFHTHNITDWDIVEKTRDNAFYLYFVLLGSCIIPEEKISKLGIFDADEFDELCKKIRKFSCKSYRFVFDYIDGTSKELLYGVRENTIDFASSGYEHYDSLLFYDVQTFDDVDKGVDEENKIYLTRENSSTIKVYGVVENNQKVEIL